MSLFVLRLRVPADDSAPERLRRKIEGHLSNLPATCEEIKQGARGRRAKSLASILLDDEELFKPVVAIWKLDPLSDEREPGVVGVHEHDVGLGIRIGPIFVQFVAVLPVPVKVLVPHV